MCDILHLNSQRDTTTFFVTKKEKNPTWGVRHDIWQMWWVYFTYPCVKELIENVWKGEDHSKQLLHSKKTFYIQLSESLSVRWFLSVRVLICHQHLLLWFLRPARSSCFLLSSQLFQMNVWHFRLENSAIQLCCNYRGGKKLEGWVLEGNKEENGWLKTIQAYFFSAIKLKRPWTRFRCW